MKLSYPYICSNKADVPNEALPHLDRQILEYIGGHFSELFPLFSKTFIKTTHVIETYWSVPQLVLKKGMREWLKFLVVQRSGKNLFFLLQPEFMDKHGESFDDDYQMLPDSWKEIYRWFDSFCVTHETYFELDWFNSPLKYSSRLPLHKFKIISKATEKHIQELTEFAGCARDNLYCWLLTENGEALFINEESSDGRVFHINVKQKAGVMELYDPKLQLDEYLAHYLYNGMEGLYFYSLKR